MKVGFTSYSIAFQRPGGLEVQIRQSLAAVQALGIDARLVSLHEEKLWEYDIVHQFSLNHSACRILQVAKAKGVATVVSPVVTADHNPSAMWRVNAKRSLINKLFGNEFRGKWDDIALGLRLSDAVCALTENDRRVIEELGACQASRIHVVPNGVTEAFFDADPAAFQAAHPEIGDFILLAASIQPYKNQLSVIQAAVAQGYTVVLIGSISDEAYFRACMEAGGDKVHYLGVLPYPSPELTSIYAAAKVVVLASLREPFGLVPFEGLAAGSAAILTTKSGVERPSDPPYFQRVNPKDEAEIGKALKTAMAAPRDREKCRALVKDMRWSHIGTALAQIYRRVHVA